MSAWASSEGYYAVLELLVVIVAGTSRKVESVDLPVLDVNAGSQEIDGHSLEGLSIARL